jgi:PLD-like domain
MTRIYSNGPGNFIKSPFLHLARRASRLHLAAPFFTAADDVIAAGAGKPVQLLVGLNSVTRPDALAAVMSARNITLRYFTHRSFHLKIYLFDDSALLGSGNLTNGGLFANREADICLDQPEDFDAVQEIRVLFAEMWDAAKVLNAAVFDTFATAWRANRPQRPGPDEAIENAIGRVEPSNISVTSRTKSTERLFIDTLQRQVYEEYLPAFTEVTTLLEERGFRRPELVSLGLANETNRFLNWVRKTHAVGEDTWRSAPILDEAARRDRLLALGTKWVRVDDSAVPADYTAWLRTVERIFGTPETLQAASKDTLTEGLMSIHAFTEQLRFVEGGSTRLPAAFWSANADDVDKVRNTLHDLIHGPGDFVERLHDALYDRSKKINKFGLFSALELYGSVKPDECPPMNGRMAKALRYLGFGVQAA